MKEIRSIILAAGKGTRMKSSIPKVLHPICGRPMIQNVIDVARGVGSSKVYCVLGHKSSSVAEALSDDLICVEQKKLLGTADAVKAAATFLKSYKGDVLIMCGDTPLLSKQTVKSIVRKHRKNKNVCTFLTAVVHDPQGYGRILRKENGAVVAIREDKDAVGYEKEIAEINVGVYCFHAPELFKVLNEIKPNAKKKEFYLTDIVELYTEKKLKVDAIETEDATEGLGVNTREDLANCEQILRRRILKEFMLQGVTISDPSTTYIDSSVVIGKDTIIRPYTFIEGDVRIGDDCQIGPFARIRPGSKIGNGVEIGNFTEVSRTKIGDQSIMKHFSFLGDSIIGSKVNIGAGTVTANFDGVDKNTTRVADGAFIGSDAILISPVKIGKNAIVGAGSVVTKDKTIPDGAVVTGVPAQIISRKK